MSGFVWIGLAIGCWAMLSVLSGEFYRQQQESAARLKAKKAAELAQQSEILEVS